MPNENKHARTGTTSTHGSFVHCRSNGLILNYLEQDPHKDHLHLISKNFCPLISKEKIL